MTENNYDDYEIIMNLLIKKNEKNYILIISSNKSRDFAIFLIQQASLTYCSKYVLEDFKKINFFKNYLNYGLKQCIDILINLLKEKQNLINIEEEEKKFLKISLEIEIGIVGLNINLPNEKIEISLEFDEIDQIIKNNLFWHTALFLFSEKEEDKKKLLEQENKINKLNQQIYELKEKLDESKITPFYFGDFFLKNDLRKSKILNENNIQNFEFVKKRLKLYNNEKKVNFSMLYSAKINGDKSQNFHEFCDNHKNTLIIIKTVNNAIFGGFAGKTWNSMELGRKKDTKSFLFSLMKQKIYNPKIDSKYHLYCSDNDGPCFYAFSVNNIFLQNGGFCDEIYKCNFDSFESEYELNDGIKQFQIEELEVFEISFL